MPETAERHSSSADPLKARIAVITGANRGIGFALANALAAAGCHLAITSRTAANAESAAEKLSVHATRILPLQCDVREELAVARIFEAVKADFGHIDILINNAGHSHAALPIERLSIDVWQQTLATNLTGTFLCTRAALPLMRKGSTIVNNISIVAYQTFPNSAAYIASKAGVLAFTNALREELRGRGIRVMSLVAGATDTDIWQQFWPEAPREKMMSPSDVTSVVVAALRMPPEASVEEIKILPTVGKL
ncbi:MAG TPA: SDR family oxidoreductase [Terriglobales bacterium]|nr:SDR family oxidoreductase [Terriglobales bacterium]